VPPYIDFAPLENATDALKESAKREEKAMALLAPRAGDPKLDILEPFRMGENGDVAVTEADEMTGRGVAARAAIRAHGVESRRPGSAVDQRRRRQADGVGFAPERRRQARRGGDGGEPSSSPRRDGGV